MYFENDLELARGFEHGSSRSYHVLKGSPGYYVEKRFYLLPQERIAGGLGYQGRVEVTRNHCILGLWEIESTGFTVGPDAGSEKKSWISLAKHKDQKQKNC